MHVPANAHVAWGYHSVKFRFAHSKVRLRRLNRLCALYFGPRPLASWAMADARLAGHPAALSGAARAGRGWIWLGLGRDGWGW